MIQGNFEDQGFGAGGVPVSEYTYMSLHDGNDFKTGRCVHLFARP